MSVQWQRATLIVEDAPHRPRSVDQAHYVPQAPSCPQLRVWRFRGHSRRIKIKVSPLHQPSGQPSPVVVANMTTEAPTRPEGVNTKSTRTLLRVVILLFIAGAAISSRLFSVIRKSCPHRMVRGHGSGVTPRATAAPMDCIWMLTS